MLLHHPWSACGESLVSNSLRAAVKSRQCWSRTHSHNFITSQHTKSHYLATGEKEEELSSSTAQPRLLFLIVYWIPMGWKISSWPCHPPRRSRRTPVRAPCICIITLIAPSHLPLKQQHQHLSARCVHAAEISLESKRAHKAPFYLHTLRFPIQSVFGTFLLSPNAHRVQRKTFCELNKKRILLFKQIFSQQGHLKCCSIKICSADLKTGVFCLGLILTHVREFFHIQFSSFSFERSTPSSLSCIFDFFSAASKRMCRASKRCCWNRNHFSLKCREFLKRRRSANLFLRRGERRKLSKISIQQQAESSLMSLSVFE